MSRTLSSSFIMDDNNKLLESHSDLASIDDDCDVNKNCHKSIEQYIQDLEIYSRKRIRFYIFIVAVFTLLFVFTNLGWYWIYHSISNHKLVEGPTRPTYFLETFDPETIIIPFSHDWQGLADIEESPGGYRYADERWEDWVPYGGGNVAVPRELQQSLKLDPRASPLNDNPSNFHYLIASYHQQHCLLVVRDTIYQLNGTLLDTEPLNWDHVLHCIEAVRQAIVCFSDPTLLPVGLEWPGIPNGQEHVCVNRPALKRWANKFQHDSPVFINPHNSTPHTEEWLQRHQGRQV